MNIENEKDLQVWLEFYKLSLAACAFSTIADCATETDCAFAEYKKRAKALEEVKVNDWIEWNGIATDTTPSPYLMQGKVKVLYRDGTTGSGWAYDFGWMHLGKQDDIVAFKIISLNSSF